MQAAEELSRSAVGLNEMFAYQTETLFLEIKFSGKLSSSNLTEEFAPLTWLWLIRKLRSLYRLHHSRIIIEFKIFEAIIQEDISESVENDIFACAHSGLCDFEKFNTRN